MAIMRRILILLWAVAASLLTLTILGFSNVFSTLFGADHVLKAFDISLVVFTVIYALIFRLLFKRCQSVIVILIAFLPPFLIIWLFLIN